MLRFILKRNRIGTIAIAVLICFLCSDFAFATSRAGSDTDAAVALPSSPTTPTGSRIEGQRTLGIRLSATTDGPPSGTRSPPGGRATSSEDGKSSEHRKHGGGDRWWIPVAIVGAVAVVAGVAAWLTTRTEPSAADLRRDGPMFPDELKMSAIGIVGLVQGNWPMVIDLEQGRAGEVRLYINAKGAQEVFSLPLSKNPTGRRLIVLTLPPELGAQPQPAVIALIATDGTSSKTLIPLQVYAIGAGPRAVGSVSIDQILFGPDTIHVSKGEKAPYRFYSHSDFDNLSVEFVKVDRNSIEGDQRLVDAVKIPGGVRRHAWIGKLPDGRRDWTGYNGQNQISEGDHNLRIRVWHQQGDWTAAWSESMVTVSP